MKSSRSVVSVCSVLVIASGCVSANTHDQTVKQLDAARAALSSANNAAAAEAATAKTEREKLAAELVAAKAQLTQEQDQAKTQLSALQKSLDGATAEDAQLRKELERLGKNADKLLAEKGTLASALEDAKTRLEELRRAESAAAERAALFRDLVAKFQKMIDAGQLQIILRDGRMVLQLSNDVLFDTASVVVKPEGQAAIKKIAAVLKTIPKRHFQVAGHTDSVPMHSQRFASNWELSNGRAVEVVHLLIAQGLAPEVLSAAGYGEFDPIAANDTDAGRQKNRRTEITLQPNIDELVAFPQTQSSLRK